MSEIESSFIILSRDYNKIHRLIGECIFNNGYEVEEKENQISDVYFDTTDEILENKETELRIRTIDDKVSKITLKIQGNTTETYSERAELEEIWSKESLSRILFRLGTFLNLHIGNTTFKYSDDPKMSLLELGFKIIQNRETSRMIINAVDKKTKQTAFEFAFDTTTYIFDDNDRIRIVELEIESKEYGNYVKLSKIVNVFKADPSLFKIWPYSKLLTGKAIEILSNNNRLKEIQDYDDKNILTLTGLKKIESFIKFMNT